MTEKCSDRRYLSNFDLDIELFKKFNLKVKDLYPVRSVFMVYTDKGNRILKKVNYTEKELEFINNALIYIRKNFSRVMDFEKTEDGTIYTIWNNDLYCMMTLVEGRECDYNNPMDIAIASKGLGELHRASLGFKCNVNNKYMNAKLIDNMEKRKSEIEFFKSLAKFHEIKSNFDIVFLNNVDYYMEQIDKSLNILKHSAYYKVCNEEDKVAICHHDLAHHNIMINNDEAYFIDFDYMLIDLRIHDVCNLMTKAIKNFAYDIDRAKCILYNYGSVSNLDERELEILYGMLCFPEDFYWISKDYYSRRKDWEESVFFDRLIKKIEFKEEKEEFLQLFSEEFL